MQHLPGSGVEDLYIQSRIRMEVFALSRVVPVPFRYCVSWILSFLCPFGAKKGRVWVFASDPTLVYSTVT